MPNNSISFKVSKTSLKDIVKEVEGYTKVLKEQAEEVLSELAEMARDSIQEPYQYAEYDGEKDFQVTVQTSKSGGTKVIASGESVYFLEFGAGVYNEEDYPGELPSDYAPIGSYGNGHGADDYWFFSPNPGDENLSAGGAHATYKVKEWDYVDDTYIDPATGRKYISRGREWTGEYEEIEKENSIITHGNPPTAAMYYAFEDLKEEAINMIEDRLND